MRSVPLVLDLAAIFNGGSDNPDANLTCEKLNEWYAFYINKYAKLNVIITILGIISRFATNPIDVALE